MLDYTMFELEVLKSELPYTNGKYAEYEKDLIEFFASRQVMALSNTPIYRVHVKECGVIKVVESFKRMLEQFESWPEMHLLQE